MSPSHLSLSVPEFKPADITLDKRQSNRSAHLRTSNSIDEDRKKSLSESGFQNHIGDTNGCLQDQAHSARNNPKTFLLTPLRASVILFPGNLLIPSSLGY